MQEFTFYNPDLISSWQNEEYDKVIELIKNNKARFLLFCCDLLHLDDECKNISKLVSKLGEPDLEFFENYSLCDKLIDNSEIYSEIGYKLNSFCDIAFFTMLLGMKFKENKDIHIGYFTGCCLK